MSETPAALIASDDRIFSGALAAAMSGHFDVTVVRADDRLDVEGMEPSVVIMDTNGTIPVSVRAVAASCATLVLGPDDPEAMIEAVEAGVLGYMIRESPLSEIEEGAISIAGGTAVIPPFMLGSLLHHVVERRRVEQAATEQLESLTPRESDVFELAAMGLSHDDVGDRLFISPATARTHLHRIFKKLEIHSKAELVALAASCGLPTTEET